MFSSNSIYHIGRYLTMLERDCHAAQGYRLANRKGHRAEPM